MHVLLDELQEKIESNTDVSFTGSEAEPAFPVDLADPEQSVDETFHQHVGTALTDDMVVTMDGWLDEKYFHDIDNKVVVTHLDEVLLVLIAVREGGCGKELRQDIRRLFGADLSPGTVYPHLNDLEEDGVLGVKELSRQKMYYISDEETAFDAIESVVNQLFATSLVLKALMADCGLARADTYGGEHDGT